MGSSMECEQFINESATLVVIAIVEITWYLSKRFLMHEQACLCQLKISMCTSGSNAETGMPMETSLPLCKLDLLSVPSEPVSHRLPLKFSCREQEWSTPRESAVWPQHGTLFICNKNRRECREAAVKVVDGLSKRRTL